MRPARLRRKNQIRLSADHCFFLSFCCFCKAAYTHTCLICAGRAANRATSCPSVSATSPARSEEHAHLQIIISPRPS